MGIFNSLEFGGVNSLQHDVYITGEGVYNMPERDIESVEIPGRNGDFLLDKSRWKNIDVTYHCGTFGDDQTEFGSKMRAFRNQLASKYGYQRITDTYYPDEFRLGVFKNAVEVDAVAYKRAGEFDVTFNCKPQRYLISGESAVDMDSGDSLYNPTPFDASPLLEVEGYGSIEFNGHTIDIDEGFYGIVDVADAGAIPTDTVLKTEMFNDGDTITIKPFAVNCHFGADSTHFWTSPTVTNTSGAGTTAYSSGSGTRNVHFKTTFGEISFASNTDYSNTTTATLSATHDNSSGGFTTTGTQIITITVNYTASTHTVSIAVSSVTGSFYPSSATFSFDNPMWNGATADSTKSTMTGTTYIDCDLGDAYKIEDGEYASLNSYIDLGSDLPTLASGANEVTFSNTITSLKIIPRYWIL